jgi:quercetin dioxygenase-like cupin family protein
LNRDRVAGPDSGPVNQANPFTRQASHAILRDAADETEEFEMTSTGQSATTAAQARVPGIERTDLQHYDLSAPGREMIQNRVVISPEAQPIRHKHPGEEIIYVLEGSLEYQIDGREPRTYSAGEALTVPAETVHSVHGHGTELATYVVEKGKPFIVLAD